MEHALAVLEQSDLWDWPITRRLKELGEQSGKSTAATPKLLYILIMESQKFGGEVLDQFWTQLGACDEKLRNNVESLKTEDFVSANRSFELLFRGLDPNNINFKPVLRMAAEYFTHLGVAFLNPGGPKSGGGTEYSVSEAVNEDTDKLLQLAAEQGGFGKRNQHALKALCFKRDGQYCLLTHKQFEPFNKKGFKGFKPTLTHIIPNSVHGKPDTLKCLAMFAGDAARDEVNRYLNDTGNIINMQQDAHTSYDELRWGIEAKEEDGKVKYIFRMIPTDPEECSPGLIDLSEGEEILFGKGTEGKKLDYGPNPVLCNLRLAVARVLKMSGAADIILEWKDEADDEGFCRLFVTSEEDCDKLDAKLLLSGRTIVA